MKGNVFDAKADWEGRWETEILERIQIFVSEYLNWGPCFYRAVWKTDGISINLRQFIDSAVHFFMRFFTSGHGTPPVSGCFVFHTGLVSRPPKASSQIWVTAAQMLRASFSALVPPHLPPWLHNFLQIIIIRPLITPRVPSLLLLIRLDTSFGKGYPSVRKPGLNGSTAW